MSTTRRCFLALTGAATVISVSASALAETTQAPAGCYQTAIFPSATAVIPSNAPALLVDGYEVDATSTLRPVLTSAGQAPITLGSARADWNRERILPLDGALRAGQAYELRTAVSCVRLPGGDPLGAPPVMTTRFLASESAAFITGATLDVNGGQLMA